MMDHADTSDSGLQSLSPFSGHELLQEECQTSTAALTKEQTKYAKEVERKRKREQKEKAILQKTNEKKAKEEERQHKKLQQENEKLKKRALQEAQRNNKPGQCMKQMTVILDPGVLEGPCGAAILDSLKQQDVRYEIQQQVIPNIITFSREVTTVVGDLPGKVDIQRAEVIEDLILLCVPITSFIPLVNGFKQGRYGGPSSETRLRDYVANISALLEGRKVTLLVQGLDKYFKEQGRGRKPSTVTVTRIDVEEALIDLQLHTGCNVRFAEKEVEVSKALLQFTKAVAEAPNKQMRMNTGVGLFLETSGSVKISKDGQGLTQAWRQQLQQFKNVSAEIANAIMAEYPTPQKLWMAYNACGSSEEAALLLQDIVVRRGVGVLATSRRVGKELSRKVHTLLTQTDPDFVIK